MQNKIYKKYSDPAFPGSFSGVETFHKALKKEERFIKKKDVKKSLVNTIVTHYIYPQKKI